MNTNFKVIGLTRLGIKPKSTAQDTDALHHSAISAVIFLHPHNNERAENSVCTVIFISFQNITRENVCLTFGHLVSLCRRQARARQSRARQSRARQSNSVVRLIK